MKVTFLAIGYPPPLDRRDLMLVEGSTLGEMLERLSAEYGPSGLAGVLALNDRIVERPDSDTLPLKEGDQVILAPPLSGG
jgi:molybdopterin converting factor small subunit